MIDNYRSKLLLAGLTLYIFSYTAAFGQDREFVKGIYIDRENVYDSLQARTIFAADIFNSLHTMTKMYIIEDELLFSEGDELDYDLIEESERNLRAMGIFSRVNIELDSTGSDSYDIFITAQDRWSTYPSLLFGTAGGVTEIGGRLQEFNFLGQAYYFSLEALYRTENDIGWQGEANFNKRRIFRSEYTFEAFLKANRIRTDQRLSFYQPYRTLATEHSYGFTGSNSYGSDFLYALQGQTALINFHERNVKFWFSKAWMKKDRVFATLALELNDVNRGDSIYRRAYDNTGRILMAFSSVSNEFVTTTMINGYNTEDITIGGWGSAVLGKIFSMGKDGESLFYVAGQGEQSFYSKNVYLFGQLSASSAFKQSSGKYTYEEFFGLGFFRINHNIMFAARVRQQTVWNWDAQRQLILDYEYGLRGYEANEFAGDNRIVSNFEFRFFPDWTIWIVKFSGVLFYDVGSVWNSKVELTKAQFHNAAGIGLRFHDTKSTGANSIFRVDIAYNFERKQFGFIISTDQLFSAYGKHEFKIPEIYGMEFNAE
jgi:hypothetical protein